MNFILDTQQEVMSKDMPVSTTISLTLFFGVALCGVYLYDMIQKVKQTETSVKELTEKTEEAVQQIDTHEDTLLEYDQRIREKKDYSADDEVEEKKYQAWKGYFEGTPGTIYLKILIWREKYSTVKKNQEWTHWEKKEDGSSIVRDFYLGNGNPDFSWIVKSGGDEESIWAEMKDTLINGWDSVCKLHISMTATKKDLLEFVGEKTFEGSKTLNTLLKKGFEGQMIHWERLLIDT
jgi:hypothetical protein